MNAGFLLGGTDVGVISARMVQDNSASLALGRYYCVCLRWFLVPGMALPTKAGQYMAQDVRSHCCNPLETRMCVPVMSADILSWSSCAAFTEP